jgi:hypothetical protein
MDQFYANLAAVALMVELLVLVFLIRNWLFKRAVFQVIAILRRERSTCTERSKTPDELGLAPPGLFERFGKTRDYKPYALKALIQAGAVRTTEDGRVCLAEENLAEELQ